MKFINVSHGRIGIIEQPDKETIKKIRDSLPNRLAIISLNNTGYNEESRACAELGVTFISLPTKNLYPHKVPDKTAEYVNSFTDTVARARSLLYDGYDVIIHCKFGIDRSGLMAYAILRSMSYSDAEIGERIKYIRPVAWPISSRIKNWIEWWYAGDYENLLGKYDKNNVWTANEEKDYDSAE
jgi:protein-tyrosine phosphatase